MTDQPRRAAGVPEPGVQMASERPGVPGNVPILLYHAITDDPGEHIAPFAVSPGTFRRHLDLLQESGYRCLTFGELMQRRARAAEGPATAVPERTAVLTFDDGFADFAGSALPALRARGLPATLYVTTGWLQDAPRREPGPSDPMLAWSQLPELLEAGIELGAHSHSHPHLDTLSTRALRAELSLPKALMEDALGRPVTTFAYPHGYHGPRVRRLTQEAGYQNAAAVRNALSRPTEHGFSISRLTVGRTTTPEQFAGWLAGVDGLRTTHRERLATKGWRMYRRGRALLRRAPGSDFR
ncbi:MAG TPA: polysaccharide deacetylase family protein [Blastococcus sp.]